MHLAPTHILSSSATAPGLTTGLVFLTWEHEGGAWTKTEQGEEGHYIGVRCLDGIPQEDAWSWEAPLRRCSQWLGQVHPKALRGAHILLRKIWLS